MGELTFFLGLQVTQKDDGIFISQDKYTDKILKKFGFSTMKTASTPIETSKPLVKDENAEDVGVHLYRSMIGSLMYLTSSRPNNIYCIQEINNMRLSISSEQIDFMAMQEANSTTEVEYVAASNFRRQLLWI
ncbi:hypothetical protein Tco_0230599 [Tanacetum coccineum]